MHFYAAATLCVTPRTAVNVNIRETNHTAVLQLATAVSVSVSYCSCCTGITIHVRYNVSV